MHTSSSLVVGRRGLSFKELTVVLALMALLVLASMTGLRAVQQRTMVSVAETRAATAVTAMAEDAVAHGGGWPVNLSDVQIPAGVELVAGAATSDGHVSVHVHGDGTLGVSVFVDTGLCVVGRVTAVGDMPSWGTQSGYLCDAASAL